MSTFITIICFHVASAADLPPKTSKSPKKAEKTAKEKKGHSQSEQEVWLISGVGALNLYKHQCRIL